MNGLTESPLFKIFATTNSLFLGAGALYLFSFGRESVIKVANHKEKISSFKKEKRLDKRVKYTEIEGNFALKCL